MKSKKKILWISHASTLFGAERVLLDGVKGLEELKFDVNVVLPSKGELSKRLDYNNISILNLPWWIDRGSTVNLKAKFKVVKGLVNSVYHLVKEIRRLKSDVIISNTIAIPSGAFASFILGKKHIWYIHEFGKEDHNFNFIFNEWFSCKIISLFSNKIICNSIVVKNKFEKYIKKDKIKLIYYPVEINSKFKKKYGNLIFNTENPIKIALFGRVAKSKGQFEAIQAIEYLIVKKKYNIVFKVIGAGNDEYTLKLKEYIIEKKLENNIEIMNFVPNSIEFMKLNDICLNCSIMEAFGLITIESMKLGIPVIASNTGGNLELIQNNRNGVLYNQGDFNSLAEKIEFLYLNPSEIIKMGNFGYYWANEKFNMKNYQKDLETII